MYTDFLVTKINDIISENRSSYFLCAYSYRFSHSYRPTFICITALSSYKSVCLQFRLFLEGYRLSQHYGFTMNHQDFDHRIPACIKCVGACDMVNLPLHSNDGFSKASFIFYIAIVHLSLAIGAFSKGGNGASTGLGGIYGSKKIVKSKDAGTQDNSRRVAGARSGRLSNKLTSRQTKF